MVCVVLMLAFLVCDAEMASVARKQVHLGSTFVQVKKDMTYAVNKGGRDGYWSTNLNPVHQKLNTDNSQIVDTITNGQVVKSIVPYLLSFGLFYLLRELTTTYSTLKVNKCSVEDVPPEFKHNELRYDLLMMHQDMWPSITEATRMVVGYNSNRTEIRAIPLKMYQGNGLVEPFLAVMLHNFEFHAQNAFTDSDMVVALDCKTLGNGQDDFDFMSTMETADSLGSLLNDRRAASSKEPRVTLDLFSPAEGYKWCPNVDVDVEIKNVDAYLRLEKNPERKCYTASDSKTGNNAQADSYQRELDGFLETTGSYQDLIRRMMQQKFDFGNEDVSMDDPAKGVVSSNLIHVAAKPASTKHKLFLLMLTVCYLAAAIGPPLTVLSHPDLSDKETLWVLPKSDIGFNFYMFYTDLVTPFFIAGVTIAIGLALKISHRAPHISGTNYSMLAGLYVCASIGAVLFNQVRMFYTAQQFSHRQEFMALRIFTFTAEWFSHMLEILFFANAMGQSINEVTGTWFYLPALMTPNSERLVLGLVALFSATAGFIHTIHGAYDIAATTCDLRSLHDLIDHEWETPSYAVRNPDATITYQCENDVPCNETDDRLINCPWEELKGQQSIVEIEDVGCLLYCTPPGGEKKQTMVRCVDGGLVGGVWEWDEIKGQNLCDNYAEVSAAEKQRAAAATAQAAAISVAQEQGLADEEPANGGPNTLTAKQ